MSEKYIEMKSLKVYLEKKLEIDFAHVELSIPTEPTPLTYRGQGFVWQSENYSLKFKMIHNYTDDDRERFIWHEKTIAGKLVGSDKMFTLRGIALDATNEWIANDVWFSPTFQMPSNGLKIEAEIKSIGYHTEMERHFDHFSCEYAFLGKYQTPLISFLEYPDGSSCRNMCKTQIGNITISTISNSDYLVLRVEGPSDEYSEDLIECIKEAIEISIGNYLHPIMKDLFNNSFHELKYFSPIDNESKKLYPPFNSNRLNSSSFSDFLIEYVNKMISPKSFLHMNWYKVVDSTDNNLDNQGLIQGVAIEGIIQKYFSDYGKPSLQDRKQIENAICKISNINFASDDIKNRIIRSTNNWLGSNNRTALKRLKDEGKITDEMFNAWEKLRHPLAHGEIMSAGEWNELQNFYSNSKAILSLFYRLIFLIIGYKGKYINYAKLGYPEEELDLE